MAQFKCHNCICYSSCVLLLALAGGFIVGPDDTIWWVADRSRWDVLICPRRLSSCVFFCNFGNQLYQDNVISCADLYGGTWNLFANTPLDQGIEVRVVDRTDPENFAGTTGHKAWAYYSETLTNPKLRVFPIALATKIGKRCSNPLIANNIAAPLLVHPVNDGTDVVGYSFIKHIGGHGESIGGAILDRCKFDWETNVSRIPASKTPYGSHHSAVWTQAGKPLGPIAYIPKARLILLRD